MVILLVTGVGAALHAIPAIGPPISAVLTYTAAGVQFVERVLVG